MKFWLLACLCPSWCVRCVCDWRTGHLRVQDVFGVTITPALTQRRARCVTTAVAAADVQGNVGLLEIWFNS